MAARLIGTDSTNPRLPAVVVAATQGTSAADLAPGTTLADAAEYTDLMYEAAKAYADVLIAALEARVAALEEA